MHIVRHLSKALQRIATSILGSRRPSAANAHHASAYGLSRRNFLRGCAAGAASVAVATIARPALAQTQRAPDLDGDFASTPVALDLDADADTAKIPTNAPALFFGLLSAGTRLFLMHVGADDTAERLAQRAYTTDGVDQYRGLAHHMAAGAGELMIAQALQLQLQQFSAIDLFTIAGIIIHRGTFATDLYPVAPGESRQLCSLSTVSDILWMTTALNANQSTTLGSASNLHVAILVLASSKFVALGSLLQHAYQIQQTSNSEFH